MSSGNAPASSVDEVLSLYERWGHDPYDEDLGQLDHALQTAALARRDGAPDALVAAALLHDVGHLLQLDDGKAFDRETGDLRHEAVGAQFLCALFRTDVTAPIASHVRAKRYRCTVDSDYRRSLSPSSERSLIRQGGVLTAAAVVAFEQSPGFTDAVRLRGWDDGGKVPDLEVSDLESYRQLLLDLAVSPA